MKTPAAQIEKVIFRKYRGKNPDVVAMFPEIPADVIGSYVTVYEQVGQHGAATLGSMLDLTHPAAPHEYAPLKRELESIGYALEVCRRVTLRMNSNRREKALAQRAADLAK